MADSVVISPVDGLPRPAYPSLARDICIELWIDQEGFRAIRPKFHLAGYTNPALLDSPSASPRSLTDVLTQGLVQLHPVGLETSTYHHGALDGVPTLRRLTLADREDKDYISRQARLSVRANGVYVVSGAEPFDLPFVPTSARPTLVWRFDFACAPGLLHPARGTPIGLLAVLRKRIAPKLAAAPLAPHAARTRRRERDAVAWPSASSGAGVLKAAALGLQGHRRVRSSEPAGSGSLGAPPATTRASSDGGACGAEETMRSSVSFTYTTSFLPVAGPVPSASTVARSDTVASKRGSRQIITREELAAILASFPSPKDGGEKQVGVDGSVPTALSPPSYYKHRRTQSETLVANEMGVMV
ncbi:uncharacterized protein BXZ73DRAFT_96519 [Epithele typhae]|uniref:uncharacterized protein n=1 Tax=Epithele typhae TaxID=378194 RepID=UPI0020083415|nr:uncharacterized protein BXZ73DRAFT_96519 [Epithele typhae]KAH9944004.1 hypothetical protein BXZ73DRAFT_96519 [Epithele typhae]